LRNDYIDPKKSYSQEIINNEKAAPSGTAYPSLVFKKHRRKPVFFCKYQGYLLRFDYNEIKLQ